MKELLSNFTYFFPQNKPRGALRIVLQIFNLLEIDYKHTDEEQMPGKIKRAVRKSLSSNSDRMFQATCSSGVTASSLLALCIALIQEIDDITYYSDIFPSSMIEYEEEALATYYNSFENEFQKVSKNRLRV
jgi:DNA-binding Xre family transcriptional regulator